MNARRRKIQTEPVSGCPVCGSTEFETEISSRDFESSTGRFCVERCLQCAMRFTNPRPTAQSHFDLYRSRQSADYVKSQGITDYLRALALRRWISTIVAHSGHCDPVLDYGCGDGFFSRQLARCGRLSNIAAVDLHDLPPAALENQHAVRYLSFEQLQKENGQYQLVFCRHVIEHLSDPSLLLGQLERLLMPGGTLVVEVPNFDSVWRKIFGPYYFGLYLPRHLLHFDGHSLCKLFGRYRQVRLYHTHTPVVGQSLGYLSGTSVGNLGLIGLSLYPLQVLVDRIARSSSVLSLVLRKQNP